ncbi:MAG TPA: thiamine phosphate synthase [Actinomycetota bacterium]
MLTSSGLVPHRDHREIAEAAIRGGAAAVQLRAPELVDEELLPLAMALADRCREEGVMFLVNNRLDVAAASKADGAHVGQSDDIAGARSAIGPDRVLGVSIRGPEDIPAAEAAGADYLGVTVWETATKPEARPLGLEGLKSTADATDLPIVGIGGIDASNAREVIEAGAVGVAVISSVGGAADPVSATRALVEAVRTAKAAT